MLRIQLYRDARPLTTSRNERGDGRSGRYSPEGLFPLSFSSLREESWAAWRDAQYAAHAAHAVDPWVLDGCPPAWAILN
jgi:hypothetical protein